MKTFLKTVGLALACLVAVALATPAYAITDLTGGNTAPTVMPGGRGVVRTIKIPIDFATSAYNLTTSTQYQILAVPAGTLVMNVAAEVLRPEGATLTFNVGDADLATGWLSAFDANGAVNAHTNSLGLFATGQAVALNFYDYDMAASKAVGTEMGTDPSADAGGANFKRVPMAFAGSVIGVSVFSNTAITQGNGDFAPTIDGTSTTLKASLGLVSGNTTVGRATQALGVQTFTAGQAIGLKYTTSSAWLPVTADVMATVFCSVNQTSSAASPIGFGKYYTSAGKLLIVPAEAATHGKLEFSVTYIQF